MTKDQSGKNFARLLRSQLDASDLTQTSLASSMDTTRAYVSSLASGTKSPTPERINQIGENLSLAAEDVEKLHKAAARDLLEEKGFKIDLPDDW